MASRRGIPVVVVNGRLTERSHRRLKRIGRLVRPMFAELAWVGAQDQAIADRFISLGVPAERVEVTGSLKWDTAQVADRVNGADALAAALGIDPSRPLWVCGSTGPGEEEIILDAYRELLKREDRRGANSVRLAIIPRKPERFRDVGALIERLGFRCVRRSDCPDGSRPQPPDLKDAVILGDTMGELRKFYCLASVVFVGRTLVSLGGSDPMEVAGLGKPILIGPRFENFELPAKALLEGGGARLVHGADELAGQVADLLSAPNASAVAGAKGRQVVLHNQGATQRTADRLAAHLGGFLQTQTAQELQATPAAGSPD